MVKKFIKGLLKKGGDKKTPSNDVGEVPDELPPLAEDMSESGENKAEEKEVTAEAPKEDSGKEEKKEKPEAETEPKELPPLEEEKLPEEDKFFEEFKKTSEEEVKKSEGKPESEEKKNEKKTAETKEELPEKRDKGLIKKSVTKTEERNEKGFFSELTSLIEDKGVNESILGQDLLKRMKEYWYFHPQEKIVVKTREKLEQDILDSLSQLKRLEERWIAQKRFLEEDMRVLLEKEKEIKAKTKELKTVLNQLRFYREVSPDKAFWLRNGIPIKSMYELIKVLEVIDETTFSFHVNNEKNDFSNWLRDVIGDIGLAEKVFSARTREEMLAILESVYLGFSGIGADKYFKMKNGRIVRDIKGLLLALRDIDEATFSFHVNNEKNDFSRWVRDVFKNDYLANKLESAKSREQFISLLEDFLRS